MMVLFPLLGAGDDVLVSSVRVRKSGPFDHDTRVGVTAGLQQRLVCCDENNATPIFITFTL